MSSVPEALRDYFEDAENAFILKFFNTRLNLKIKISNY